MKRQVFCSMVPSVTTILLVVLLTMTTAVMADSGTGVLQLTSHGAGTTAQQPTFTLQQNDNQKCLMVFEMNSMMRQDVELGGITYTELAIPGGAQTGELGEAGLPVYSGLIAVPEGRSVQVSATIAQQKSFPNLKILPVQPEAEGQFSLNEDRAQGAAGNPASLVQLGEVAIYHGVPVVPFTINPTTYDQAQNLLTVASRIELSFTFSGQEEKARSRRSSTMMPESFAGLLQNKVVNFDPLTTAMAAGGDKNRDAPYGPGGYLIISPSSTSVTAALQPLIEWRGRQGYDVTHVTTLTTGTSNTQIRSYLQNFYDQADIPLEYVVLVGDVGGTVVLPTWHESISGYYGEGDHYYTMLDGDDILPDVLLGRISVRSTSSLEDVVDKIVKYETDPPRDADPGWFTRGSVVGDPSESGISTIYVSQWLKAQLESIGYTQVDTIFSGNMPTQMLQSINQGLGTFSYRGFGGMSNFTTGHISTLTNGEKLPFAVIPTCNTGSFDTYIDARSESFLRKIGGGAIGSIGMSTGGTHTRYNNCLLHGIWEGMLFGGSHTLGAAHSRGKLEVYNNYFEAEPHIPEIWAVWSNLMGDPATDMWLAYPDLLEVSHPAQLPEGAGSVAVNVARAGFPVAGLRVAAHRPGEMTVVGYSDASGTVVLDLPDLGTGTLLVTVTGHNYVPYRGSLAVGQVDLYADLHEVQLDDGGTTGIGNGDGVVNPGEIIALRCALQNLGTDLAGSVTGQITTNDPYANILLANSAFGDIPSGAQAWGDELFLVEMAAHTPAGHEVALILTATDGNSSWVSNLALPVEAADLEVGEFSWTGGGSTLDPGESGALTLTLHNEGTVSSGAISATLSSESPWVAVTDDQGSFGSITPLNQGTNTADNFSLVVSADCFAGHLATMKMVSVMDTGAVQEVEFQLLVGTAEPDDPVGPDQYGYYALDNTDVGYAQAPVYDWVEIDPNHGGQGVSVGLTDFGWEQDATRTVDLPFAFGYYGESYNELSICSNGWVAMGPTTLKHYRNFTIPSAGSPNRLIAPFWDNLNQVGNNQVYFWNDEDEHRFIVQWSRMVNYYGGQETFQVILKDPAHYPTSSGDGLILFQYETVNNTDTVNGYATVGIQNTDGSDGVLYTYYNEYAAGAAPLTSGRAILFAPIGVASGATCEVNPGNINLTLAPGASATRTLSISNNGLADSQLHFSLSKVDANIVDAQRYETGEKSLEGSYMEANVAQYQPGQVMDVQFTVHTQSPDQEWIVQVMADLPSGVIVNSGTGMTSSHTPFSYNQSVGDGALAGWLNGILTNGQTGVASLNLDFSNTAGTVTIPYTLVGDNYGGAPHSIAGTIVLEPAGPTVSLSQPNGGQHWPIDDQERIVFLAGGGVENVRLELDRGLGSNWEILAEDVPASQGYFDWTVTGPASVGCRIRVSDQANPTVFDISEDPFTIGRSLAWLQLETETGVVGQGSTVDIEVTLDATGLELGTHAIDLVVSNSAGQPVVVPVRLTVSNGVSPVPQVPGKLTLEQNHPNPFNPQTSIGFALPAKGQVRLKVYSATGHLVRTLADEVLEPGYHQRQWNGTDNSGRRVASGVYLYRLETPAEVLTRKLILVK